MLARHLWDGEKQFMGAWNFGPGFHSVYTVQDIIDKCIQYIGKGDYICENMAESEKHESKILLLDCTKSYRYLKWQSVLDIDKTRIEVYGSENKDNFGANAILAVSMAVCKAGANSKGISVYDHIGELF